MEWIQQRWEKGTRYYEVYLQQDLWGDWVLTRVWGGRGTALGQIRDMPCTGYSDGLTMLGEVEKRRKQRGYATVETA